MNAGNPTTNRVRIGELLVNAGIIRPEELPLGLQQAEESSLKLGQVFVMLRFLSAEDLESVLAAQTMIGEGTISEMEAVEALKISSFARVPFDQAVQEARSKPGAQPADESAAIFALTDELVQAEKSLGPEHRDLADICLRLGTLRLRLNQYPDAERQFKRALQISEKSFGAKNTKLLMPLSRLADLYQLQHRTQDAEPILWRMIDIAQTVWGSDHAETARCHRKMAKLLETLGRYKDAEQFLLSALRIFERVQEREKNEDDSELTDCVRHLATFSSRQGKKPEKKRIGDILVDAKLMQADQLKEAFAIVHRDKIPLGQALVQLHLIDETKLRAALQAQLLIADGVLPSSLGMRALKAMGQRSISFDEALAELGWHPDRFTTAELKVLLATADELMSAELTLGADHAGVAVLSMKLADQHIEAERYQEADPLIRRALTILERFFGAQDPEVAPALTKLGYLYQLQGKFVEAEQTHWKALEIRQQKLGKNHIDVAESLDYLARLQAAQHNPEQAERYLSSSLAIRQEHLGRSHPRVIANLEELAQLQFVQGNVDEAERAYLRILKAHQSRWDAHDLRLAPVLERLGDIYCMRRDYSNAETQLELALEIREANPQSSTDDIANLLERYADMLRNAGRLPEFEQMDQRSKLVRRGLRP